MAKSGSSALTMSLRCKDCRFHQTLIAPGNAKPCTSLGIISEARPCDKFKVSHRSVTLAPDKLASFNEVVAGIPASQLKVIAAHLNQEVVTRKNGFKFGETVYILVLGGDFLHNYRRAVVLSADNEFVYVTGRFDRFYGALKHSSVIKLEKWEAKRKQLILSKSFVDPNHTKLWHVKATGQVSSYDPPDIDTAMKQVEAAEDKVRKRSRLRPVDDILKAVVGL